VEQGKYYVAIDKKNYNNINDELINNINSKWVLKYKPVSILQSYNKCNIDELDKYTEMYMELYGIDNVRGAGSYNKIIIDRKTNLYLKNKFNSNKEDKLKINKTNNSKKRKMDISKNRKNKLLLNNYIYDYEFENEMINKKKNFITDYSNNYTIDYKNEEDNFITTQRKQIKELSNKYITTQRKQIKELSNKFINNIINDAIITNENIIIENTNMVIAEEYVNNVVTKCVQNINLINEFDIIDINEVDKQNMCDMEKNKSSLYKMFSYFSLY
jgi:hypothetical protein